MQQDKIWDHFQNEKNPDRFFSEARQRFFLRYLSKGSDVLNIGVGSGALERLGSGKGVEMHSLDPSEKAIDRLRQKLGMGDRAKAGYAQAIPFNDDSFDMVVMSEVLEHLDDDVLSASLDEVKRVLKPGGVLLVSTPFCENLSSSKVVCPFCGENFHKKGHVQTFDKASMRQLLEEHNFSVSKLWVTTFVDWRRKGVRSFLKSVSRLFLARLGEGISDPHLAVVANNPHEG